MRARPHRGLGLRVALRLQAPSAHCCPGPGDRASLSPDPSSAPLPALVPVPPFLGPAPGPFSALPRPWPSLGLASPLALSWPRPAPGPFLASPRPWPFLGLASHLALSRPRLAPGPAPNPVPALALAHRFNYYGMKAVLPLYLTTYLSYSENEATTWIHVFTMLAYFFPLLGALDGAVCQRPRRQGGPAHHHCGGRRMMRAGGRRRHRVGYVPGQVPHDSVPVHGLRDREHAHGGDGHPGRHRHAAVAVGRHPLAHPHRHWHRRHQGRWRAGVGVGLGWGWGLGRGWVGRGRENADDGWSAASPPGPRSSVPLRPTPPAPLRPLRRVPCLSRVSRPLAATSSRSARSGRWRATFSCFTFRSTWAASSRSSSRRSCGATWPGTGAGPGRERAGTRARGEGRAGRGPDGERARGEGWAGVGSLRTSTHVRSQSPWSVC